MPTEPSLAQLSAYDPRMAIPDDSPLSGLAKRAATAPPDQENPNREKAKEFRATRDPEKRKKLLDELLGG